MFELNIGIFIGILEVKKKKNTQKKHCEDVFWVGFFLFLLVVYIKRSIRYRHVPQFSVRSGTECCFSHEVKMCLSMNKADGSSNQKYFKRLCTLFSGW